MKNKPTMLIIGVIAVLLVVVILLRHHPEPVYQGKPLRDWLALYTRGIKVNGSSIMDTGTRTPADKQQADAAVLEIGTNAFPTLLRLLGTSESPLKLKWITFVKRQPFIKPPARAWLGYSQASQAFAALGSIGNNAVPALIQLYQRKISPQSQTFIISSLENIGSNALPAAMPVFLDGSTNSDFGIRTEALFATSRIHAPSEIFVPILITALNDPSSRQSAIRALGGYGAEAQIAVPKLIPFLQDKVPYIRTATAQALKQIDPEDAAQAGVK
jgi:HEAT repeat protein